MHTEGWVDLRPALGAFVHIPTEAEADQLLAARSLLEAESARLAAEQGATAEQIEHLWELQRIGEQALAVDDQEVLVSANASLHTHIVTMSANKVLADQGLGRAPGAVVLPAHCPGAFERRLGGARRVDRGDR